jgi:hypothetical protein
VPRNEREDHQFACLFGFFSFRVSAFQYFNFSTYWLGDLRVLSAKLNRNSSRRHPCIRVTLRISPPSFRLMPHPIQLASIKAQQSRATRSPLLERWKSSLPPHTAALLRMAARSVEALRCKSRL